MHKNGIAPQCKNKNPLTKGTLPVYKKTIKTLDTTEVLHITDFIKHMTKHINWQLLQSGKLNTVQKE